MKDLRDTPACGCRTENAVDESRRGLLSGAAAVATLALAPGVTLIAGPAEARPADEPASGAKRWGMLIDTTKCEAGCVACVSACKTENGWTGHDRPATDAQWIRTVHVRDPQTGAETHVPVMCQHCSNPACVDVCPTGASFQRADSIVLVDKHICIGCRYCMMACPYKARSFVHENVKDQKAHAPRGKGTVESCTFCVHRIDAGGTPACVEACNQHGGGSMVFGDLNDPDSPVSREAAKHMTRKIRADLGLDPGILYRGI